MAIKPPSARNALGHALSNDRAGKISETDARKIKNAVINEVMTADKPKEAFELGKQVIDAAKEFIGSDKDTMKVLDSAIQGGRSAIAVRMGQLTGQAQLPQSVQDQLQGWLEGSLVLDAREGDVMKLSNVLGDEAGGFTFRLKAGDLDTDAFATKFDGDWVITPVKLSHAQLKAATDAAQAVYDEVRSNADPDGEYGFEDVAVSVRGADWEADELTLDFSHGAPEGGLTATFDAGANKWDAQEEQM